MNMHPDEVRVLGLSAPTIIRMLRAREERILGRIYGEFKNGKLDQTQALAEFACNRDLINEISAALRQHEAQETKAHGNAD